MVASEHGISPAADSRFQVAVARARDEVAGAWRRLSEATDSRGASVSVRVSGADHLVTTPSDASPSTTAEQLLLCEPDGAVTRHLALEGPAEPDLRLQAWLHRTLGATAVVVLAPGGIDPVSMPSTLPERLLQEVSEGSGTVWLDGWLVAMGPAAAGTVETALAAVRRGPPPAITNLPDRHPGGTGPGGTLAGPSPSAKDQSRRERL